MEYKPTDRFIREVAPRPSTSAETIEPNAIDFDHLVRTGKVRRVAVDSGHLAINRTAEPATTPLSDTAEPGDSHSIR